MGLRPGAQDTFKGEGPRWGPQGGKGPLTGRRMSHFSRALSGFYQNREPCAFLCPAQVPGLGLWQPFPASRLRESPPRNHCRAQPLSAWKAQHPSSALRRVPPGVAHRPLSVVTMAQFSPLDE